MRKALILLLAMLVPAIAWTGNKPCSGKKGGIERCEGSQFVCKDGTISESKRKCVREQPEKKK